MNRPTLAMALAALAAVACGAAVEAECPRGEELLSKLLADSVAEAGAEGADLAAAESIQVDAPSAGGDSTDLVDGSLFPTLLGMALNRSFGAEENNPATLNWSLFGLATLGNRDAFWDDAIYRQARFERLRRVGGTLSFGGNGKAFDRDGDGEADEALEAQNYDDIVTWEARVLLTRSRDRREAYNVAEFAARVGRTFDSADFFERAKEIRRRILLLPGAPLPQSGSCIPVEAWTRFVELPEAAVLLRQAALNDTDLEQAWEAAAEAVDNRPVATLAVGGVERGDEFGPDERYLALRGSWRGGTANLQYNEVDGLGTAPDPTCLKFGLEWAWQWSTRADVSLSASYERFHDVPDEAHEEIAKAQAKIEYTVAKGVKLPISVTWANHRDLLVDEEEVRGHMGFTLDLAGVLQALQPASRSGG